MARTGTNPADQAPTTRRVSTGRGRSAVAGATLAAVALLTACGSDDDPARPRITDQDRANSAERTNPDLSGSGGGGTVNVEPTASPTSYPSVDTAPPPVPQLPDGVARTSYPLDLQDAPGLTRVPSGTVDVEFVVGRFSAAGVAVNSVSAADQCVGVVQATLSDFPAGTKSTIAFSGPSKDRVAAVPAPAPVESNGTILVTSPVMVIDKEALAQGPVAIEAVVTVQAPGERTGVKAVGAQIQQTNDDLTLSPALELVPTGYSKGGTTFGCAL